MYVGSITNSFTWTHTYYTKKQNVRSVYLLGTRTYILYKIAFRKMCFYCAINFDFLFLIAFNYERIEAKRIYLLQLPTYCMYGSENINVVSYVQHTVHAYIHTCIQSPIYDS